MRGVWVFDATVMTGPAANYPVADSFNRTLERDDSNGDIPHVFVARALWEIPGARGITSAIATLQSGVPLAVTQITNFNAFAGFGTQRPNLMRDRRCPPARVRLSTGSTPAPSRSHRNLRSEIARDIPCAGPHIEMSMLPSRGVLAFEAVRRWKRAPRSSICSTRRRSVRQTWWSARRHSDRLRRQVIRAWCSWR